MSEITLSGVPHRDVRPPGRGHPRRIRLVRVRHMLWLVLLLASALTAIIAGTPHILWTYTYSDGPFGRVYHRCDYLGRHAQSVIPRAGGCPVFLFLKAKQDG